MNREVPLVFVREGIFGEQGHCEISEDKGWGLCWKYKVYRILKNVRKFDIHCVSYGCR